ncbi:MAG: BrnA antitoxin family protein [Proteobacteria bacterium]|nr:BrnA antitoxin family protein [Pseudomonadota bacterium]
MKKKPLTNQAGEVRELTRAAIKKMRHAHEVLPEHLLTILPRKVGQRGPQKSPVKILTTIRYSPEVLEYFKETGSGWQKRIDEALKE